MDNQQQPLQPQQPNQPQPVQPMAQQPAQQQVPGQPPAQPYAQSEFGAMIPTANKKALIGYYMGFASLLPFLGIITCIPAIVFGIQGLKYANKYPQVKGKVHAIVGIVFGVLQLVCAILFGFLVILGSSST